MAVKTKDLIIKLDELTENQTITKPKVSALYFKDKTYAQAVSSLNIVGDNLEITTTNNNYKLIITDYFKQNGKNPIKYIKTDENGTIGFLYDLINSALINNPTPITAPQKKNNYTGTVFNDVIVGTENIDIIKSVDGNDTINGSLGADKITAGKGTNKLIYENASQMNGDIITLTKGEQLTIDISAFAADTEYKVNKNNLEIISNGNTLILSGFGSKDTTNNSTKTTPDTSSVELKTSTGTINLKTTLLSQTYIEKNYTGTWHSDNVSAAGFVNAKNEKGLTIDGKAGDDLLVGSNYNDIIKAGTTGNTTISGGHGDDKLYTGSDKTSKTIFNFNVGDGLDTVFSGKGEGTINLGGVYIKDVDFARGEAKASNDLIIKYTNTDSIIVKDYYKQTNTIKQITTLESTFDMDDAIAGIGKNRVITGTQSNEFLAGGWGDDTITGALGNDTINAGRGFNTIIHNQQDGSDTILNGGGIDTLVLNDVNSKNDITVSSDGDDIILTCPNLETITLKNVSEGCSIDKIRINNNDYETDNFKNNIASSDTTITGTAWHDDINTSGLHAIVTAGEGNDVIHVTSASKVPTVYVGKGNDTISLEDTSPSCTIYFNKGDGSNVLTGLNNGISEHTTIYLHSDGLYHSFDMGELGEYQCIYGSMDGDDLVIRLTSNETFRIKDYVTLSEANKNRMVIRGHEYYNNLTQALKLDNDFHEISPVADEYTVSQNDKNELYVASDVDFPRDFYLKGNNDVLLVTGQDTQCVTIGEVGLDINANNNEIWMYNTGDSENEENQNIVQINANDNTLYLAGGNGSRVEIGGGNLGADCTNNSIHILGGKNNFVVTAGGGASNYIYADATVDEQGYGVNSITLRGQDRAYLKAGDHALLLNSNQAKTVDIKKEAHRVFIENVTGSGTTTLTQHGFDQLPSEIMFEHNPTWVYEDEYGSTCDKLAIRYLDSSGNIINSDMNLLEINDEWLNGVYGPGSSALSQHREKLIFRAENQNGTELFTRNFSDIKQYVNMNDECYNDTISGGNTIHFDEAGQSGLIINPNYYTNNGIYIKGTQETDRYSGYTFDLGQFTIHDEAEPDWGNTADELFLDMDRNDYRFFVDIDKDGNIASNDLIIYQYSDTDLECGLYRYIRGLDVDNYVVIKNEFDISSSENYFGTGAIEFIRDNDNDEYLLDCLVDEIKGAVATWVTEYNNQYGTADNPITTVSQAIADGQGLPGRYDALYSIYNTAEHANC